MGKDRSRLVEALIRSVQIAIERMGFGQGVVCDVRSEGRGGVVDVYPESRHLAYALAGSILLSLWHLCCQKGTPFPPPPAVAWRGFPTIFPHYLELWVLV
jgi:hypothetical protein